MKYVILAAIIVVLGSCRFGPTPPGPGKATCDDVCKRYDELKCEAAQPTPNGVTCAEVCKTVQESTIVRWDLECRARAASCEAAEECEPE